MEKAREQTVLTVSKRDVYNEVAMTTAYTGAKKGNENDMSAYERIFTTDEDREKLERFWVESCASVCSALKQFLEEEECGVDGYRVRLSMPRAFDRALLPSMNKSLTSFFVLNITADWYVYTNKEECTEYATAAAMMLEDVRRKAFYKKRPTRPTYD